MRIFLSTIVATQGNNAASKSVIKLAAFNELKENFPSLKVLILDAINNSNINLYVHSRQKALKLNEKLFKCASNHIDAEI